MTAAPSSSGGHERWLSGRGDNAPFLGDEVTLRQLADDDAIFSCDVGTPIAWAARYLKMNGRRRLVGSFSHGSMANAMLPNFAEMARAMGIEAVRVEIPHELEAEKIATGLL